MKIAHTNKDYLTLKESAAKAGQQEREGDLEAAAFSWNKILARAPLDPKAYDRLMIVYRKLKQDRKELDIINKAIRTFESHFKQFQPVHNKRVVALSKALLKATGLADNKGGQKFKSGELSKWERRKGLLVKKMREGKQ